MVNIDSVLVAELVDSVLIGLAVVGEVSVALGEDVVTEDRVVGGTVVLGDAVDGADVCTPRSEIKNYEVGKMVMGKTTMMMFNRCNSTAGLLVAYFNIVCMLCCAAEIM